MNRLLVATLTLLMFVNISAAAAPDSPITFNDHGSSGLSIITNYSSLEEFVENPDLKNEGIYWTKDKEPIPVISRFIAVPSGKKLVTNVLSHTARVISQVSPANLDTRVASREQLEMMTLDPPEMIAVGKPAVIRGVTVVPVSVFPVQINPADNELVFNHNMNIELKYEVDNSNFNSHRNINDKIGGAGANFVDRIIVNNPKRDYDEFQIQNLGRILILHRDGLQDDELEAIDEFATWKRQMSYRVDILEIDPDAGGNTPTNIRETIREDYYFTEDPLTHLIIIGTYNSEDAMFFPAQGAAGGGEEGDIAGDHFYTLMDQNDEAYASDISLGRIWVESGDELKAALNRSILYEREPFLEDGDGWITKAMYSAENIQVVGAQFVQSMIYLGRWVHSRLKNYGYAEVDTMYANLLGNDDIEQQTEDHLESGIGLVLSRGWVLGCYDPETDETIDTYRKHPFMVSITCLAKERSWPFFRSYDTNTINAPSGPIGIISIDAITHTKSNNGLLAWITHGITEEDIFQPGVLQLYSKWKMWGDLQWADGSIAEEIIPTFNAYQLLGDPSVHILTRSPITLHCSNPERISPNATGLEFMVTDEDDNIVPDAVVCLTNSDGFQLTTFPGHDGWARFTFNDGAPADDEFYLTVTRYNAVPCLDTIQVSTGEIDLQISSFELDDQDEMLGRGEIIPATAQLSNQSDSEVRDILFTLSSEDPWITFDPDTFEIEQIDAAGTVDIEFDVMVHDASKGWRYIRIGMNAYTADESFQFAYDFITAGPYLDVSRINIVQGEVAQGSTADLQVLLGNGGLLNSPAVSARLEWVRTRHSRAEIEIDEVVYPAIDPFESSAANDDGIFRISFDELAIPGDLVSFNLFLSAGDNDAFRDTLMFMLNLGAAEQGDPFGPDEYGYLCFDHGDEDWEKAPEFDWIEINPNLDEDFEGTNLELMDTYEDEDTSTVVELPFTFKYYGQEFDSLTICTNGWIAFGAKNSLFINARNWTLPGINAPDAMVAPLWQDLHLRAPFDDKGVFTYFDEDAGTFIIEWSNFWIYNQVHPDSQAVEDPVEIQVILYDPAKYLTGTGDGEIKFQYKSMSYVPGPGWDNQYFSTGIVNLDNSDGLEYAYWNHFPDQNIRLTDASALLFTTDTQTKFGSLEGYVYDAANREQPLEGVTVLPNRRPVTAITDADGFFRFDTLVTGTEELVFSLEGYNTLSFEYEILDGETTQAEVYLTFPGIEISPGELNAELAPDNAAMHTLTLENTGNGPLEYELDFRYPDGSMSEFERLDSIYIELPETRSGNAINSAQFVGSNIYVSADTSRRDDGEGGMILVFDREGELTESFTAPSYEDEFQDLAFDGDHFYGGTITMDGQSVIVRFDENGNQVGDDIPLPVEWLTARPGALAWNADRETIYFGYTDSQIYEINEDGEEVDRFSIRLPGSVVLNYGMSWNPIDKLLYVMDWSAEFGDMRLLKVDPATGNAEVVTQLASSGSERGKGLSIGFDWVSGKMCIATISDITRNYSLKVFEVGPDSRFVSLESASGMIEAEAEGILNLHFNSHDLTHGSEYSVGLLVSNNSIESEILVPISLSVDDNADVKDMDSNIPLEFNLTDAYPNPFNSQVHIGFSLETAGLTTLEIFDISGRRISALLSETLDRGRHEVTLDAAHLPSGIYLYRLQSSGITAVKRMVLLR